MLKIKIKIGENIKRWRVFRGFTQEQFSQKLGICRGQLGMYERGESDVMASRLHEISVLLDVDIVEMFK